MRRSPGSQGPYSVSCQRCDRSAVQRKIDNDLRAWVFAAATGRLSTEVRLCASCLSTLDSLVVAVRCVKRRRPL
jgi:hypothetical protein